MFNMTGGSVKFSYHHIDIAGTTSKFVYKYFTNHCKFKMDQGFCTHKKDEVQTSWNKYCHLCLDFL